MPPAKKMLNTFVVSYRPLVSRLSTRAVGLAGGAAGDLAKGHVPRISQVAKHPHFALEVFIDAVNAPTPRSVGGPSVARIVGLNDTAFQSKTKLRHCGLHFRGRIQPDMSKYAFGAIAFIRHFENASSPQQQQPIF